MWFRHDHFCNSLLGTFNSLLGRRKFPACAATGIGSQQLDLPHPFSYQNGDLGAKSTKFPFPRE
jgi:hypothetical protein